jgi:Bifunctional DNA primase/polymerase, N-terminal
MSVITTTDRVSYLRELIGPAVLLPWRTRSKGDRRKWKHLTLANMDRNHLAKVERAGNIGVALGQVSSGLITIDFDQDSYVDAFLVNNPLLTATLQTQGRRGCNIWVRCSAGYPPSQRLKNSSGDDIGEWRADGNQTIISGTHAEGMPYHFVVEEPVITVDYKDIIWPDVIVPPDATESKRVRGVGENEVVGVCSINGSYSSIDAFITRDLFSQVTPTDFRQNNANLYDLGRLVRSYENAIGRAATERELENVFDRWSLIAHPFWRRELTRDDYYAEFLEAYSYARIGLDENPIELAVCRAKTAPLPQVQGFTDDRIRLLVAICREMQQITGANPFFLPTRKLGDILGVHYTVAARWLRILEKPLQMIHLASGEVRRQGGSRSPRYHYGSPRPNTVGFVVTAP